MRVIIDEGRCVGGGRCAVAAPEVFDQRDSDGVVVLLRADPPAEYAESVRNAVMLCPAAAIELREER
ncbi:ferredoxin [Actinomadura sp. NEAU-AAG7]|uniref:ferredoxin n=1 Tax=Actinomadura sp. NEAU-AAG7 TaxID=2839640 RepID=UPI001BE3FE30|nr:ferredoxin [Actinomadura sp. NEAU-AAG7]MBT2212554.1 ferredoxin [Actinomadura sp. NEAU-AAG7]